MEKSISELETKHEEAEGRLNELRQQQQDWEQTRRQAGMSIDVWRHEIAALMATPHPNDVEQAINRIALLQIQIKVAGELTQHYKEEIARNLAGRVSRAYDAQHGAAAQLAKARNEFALELAKAKIAADAALQDATSRKAEKSGSRAK